MFISKVFEKRKIIYIILIVSLLVGVVFCGLYRNNKYVATSALLVKDTETENFELTNNIYSTYKTIIKNETTYSQLNRILETNLRNSELDDAIDVIKIKQSNTLEIETKLASEEQALKLNTEVDKLFIQKLGEIYKNIEIIYIDLPHISKQINDVNIVLTLLQFILAGIVISLVYVLIMYKYEAKIRNNLVSEEEKELLKPLTQIPMNKNVSIIDNDNKEITYNAFEDLKTNIQFLNINKENKKSILVTSALDKEGKSYIASNLAVDYALAGKKVVLIDSDMNFGTLGKIFSIPNSLGFSNYLSNLDENGIETNVLLNEYVKETSIKGLNIITSGTVPPNSQELLYNEKIEKLLNDLSEVFDVIIIDGSSILNKTEALILSRFANSTLIVATDKKTKKIDILTARKDIQNIGGSVLGIVLNKTKIKKQREKISIKFKKIFNKIKGFMMSKKNEVKLLPEPKENKNLIDDIRPDELINKNIVFENRVEEIEEDMGTTIKEQEQIAEKETISEEPKRNFLQFLDKFKKNKEENIEDAEEEREYDAETDYVQETLEGLNTNVEPVKTTEEVEQENIDEYLQDENTILVVVDAENAYCRIFGKNGFVEKPIRTISADSKSVKPYYSKRTIRKYTNRLRNTYGLTDEQIKRVDIVVYAALREYDDSLWTDKRIESYKAEAYVKIMANEYERVLEESDDEYLIRTQRMRKLALAKSNIDIQYKLDNLWKFNKMKFTDKFVVQKYAKEFEINDLYKNDSELLNSQRNSDFYNNIVNETSKLSNDSINKKRERTEFDKIIDEKHKKEKARIEKLEKRREKLAKDREKKQRKRAEKLMSQQIIKEQREIERERQKEEARIEEELLTDNLYPKTKFNKSL